eukprot:gene8580-10558_t
MINELNLKNNNVKDEGELQNNVSTVTAAALLSNDSSTVVDNVKVCVRIRPNTFEHATATFSDKISLEGFQSTNSVLLHCKPEPKTFSFDYVATEDTTQEELFNVVALPILNSHIDGYHGCIFAYGQTGSGKSHTIMGPDIAFQHEHQSHLKGLIPRTFDYLFEEDLKKGVFVEGLLEQEVSTSQEALHLLAVGTANRHVAATSMNSNSSRSHSVLTLSLESTNITTDGLKKFSRLCLIDLAGSERQKMTNTSGSRLKEAGSINKSLSNLGNVIRSLVDIANGKPRHVQYRDSKLTYLLKDSLGGNSKTFIIATVSPNERCYAESLSTLQFAQRAKHVKNMAIINEETSGNVSLLQMEIRKLKEELFKVLLSRSMDREELLESIRNNLIAKNKAMNLLCEKKDYFLQNTKLILHLRESHIARLEGKTSKVWLSSYEEELKEEIAILNKQVMLHPEVTRYAMKNLELKDLLANYESGFSEGRDSYEEQIAVAKQEIQELVSETNNLLKEKLQLQKELNLQILNNQIQQQQQHQNNISTSTIIKTPVKSSSSTFDTPTSSTPYIQRLKLQEEMEKRSDQWEIEKKQMEFEYQTLLQQNIKIESELLATKKLNESIQSEFNQFKNNLFKSSSNNNNNSIVIDNLNQNIIVAEDQIRELQQSKDRLSMELFEKDNQIKQLKSQLESVEMSNQKMTQVFISSPLRTDIKIDKNYFKRNTINEDEDNNSSDEEIDESLQLDNNIENIINNTPIKFNLNISKLDENLIGSGSNIDEQHEKIIELENIIKEKNQFITNLQDNTETLTSKLEQLQNQIENIKDNNNNNNNNQILENEELKKKLSELFDHLEKQRADESRLLERFYKLKLENNELEKQLDKVDEYQQRLSDQYIELNQKDVEIDQLRNQLDQLSKQVKLNEPEYIVISSEDEEDYSNLAKYREEKAQESDQEDDDDDEIDYSRIVVKKEFPDEEDPEDEKDYQYLYNNINNTSSNTTLVNNDDNDDEEDSFIRPTSTTPTSNKTVDQDAIISNLSIISQLGELEKSFSSSSTSKK